MTQSTRDTRNLEPPVAASSPLVNNMAEGETERVELIKKTGATSTIWNWFGFKPSDVQQKTIICRVCGGTVLAKTGNTTNLFYHLKSKHAIEYEECQQMQTTPSSSRKNAGQKQQELIQSSISFLFSVSGPLPFHRLALFSSGN